MKPISPEDAERYLDMAVAAGLGCRHRATSYGFCKLCKHLDPHMANFSMVIPPPVPMTPGPPDAPKLIKISPTQIEHWRRCKRSFAYHYFLHIPQAESKGMAIGNHAHKRVELYLKSGTPDYGYDPANAMEFASSRILTAVLPYLPSPAVAIAEGSFVTEYKGVTYGGRLDWRVPGVEIGDLKTTGNMRYAKTAEELAWGAQPVLYSLAHPGHECHWLYAPTSGGNPRSIHFVPHDEALDSIHETALEIVEAWKTRPHPDDLPASPEACDMYGGCPYRSICKVDPLSSVFLHRKEERGPDVNIADMKARMEALRNTPAARAPTEPAPAMPSSSEDDVTDGVDRIVAMATAAPEPEPAPEPAPEPKRRGRPRKVAPPEKPLVETAVPHVDPPMRIESDVHGDVAIFPELQVKTFPIAILLVDCFLKGSVECTDFSELVMRARPVANAALGKLEDPPIPAVADYRFGKYGKGQGVMTIALAAEIAKLSEAVVTVDSHSPEGLLAMADLLQNSRAVVRGI